jgi:cytoskeleton-associated protein 5
VLRKAMADTNLSVKMLALGIISKIATGMGSAFDKYNKTLAAAVASVCADQKATTRTTALATLSAMAEASGGLDSLYGGLATSCETANPVLRAAVLGWLAEKFAADPPASTSDLQPLASPVVHCLEDRNGDVRKAASAVLPFVVANAGADFVMDQTSGLKPASRATIIPLIEKARSNAPSAPAAAPGPSRAAPAKAAASSGTPVKARVPAGSRSAVNSPAAAGSRPAAAPVRSLAMKALSTAPSSRLPASHDERPSALPKPRMGLVRPASSMSSAPSASSSSAKIVPFQSDVPEPRIMRLKKDSAKWMLEPGPGPKSDLTEYLAHQMEHHASPELYTQLFSKDHRAEEDYMAALTTLSEFYDAAAASMFGISEDDVRALQLANVDLTLKYAALKLLLNNTQMANRCLDVIAHVSEMVARYEERFSDIEAKLFMPALIFKVSQSRLRR